MHMHIHIYYIYIYISNPAFPFNLEGFKVLLISLVIVRNFGILTVVSFPFCYEI